MAGISNAGGPHADQNPDGLARRIGDRSQPAAAVPMPDVAPALVRAGAEAFQQAGREWLAFQRHSIERAVDSFSALWRCRTLKDLVDIQTQYVADLVEEGWTRGARVAIASIARAGDARAAGEGARRDLDAAGALPVRRSKSSAGESR